MARNNLQLNQALVYRSDKLNIPIGNSEIMKILDLKGERGLWAVSKSPDCTLLRDAKYWFFSAGPYIWVHLKPIDVTTTQIYIDIGLPPARLIMAIVFFFLFTVGSFFAYPEQYPLLRVLIIDLLVFLFTFFPLFMKKDKVYNFLLEKLGIS